MSNEHLRGDWCVYYYDLSSVTIYEEEIDALRAAVASKAEIVWWPFGMSLNEAINGGSTPGPGEVG